jgi:hypothetical protein
MTEMDDDFAMAMYAPTSITGWQGAKYTRTTDADEVTNMPEMTDMVVRYTDQADPTDEAYDEYYSTTNAATREAVTGADADGVLSLDEQDVDGNHELFTGDFGITAPHQSIPAPTDDPDTDADEAMVEIDGSFNGVPGTFNCESGCSRMSDAMGNLSALGDEWTFTPTVAEDGDIGDIMVVGVVPDPDYLTFGYWRRDTETDDEKTTSGVSAFAMGNEVHDAQVTGTAKYAGPATGMYVRKTFDANGEPTPEESGQFTADAVLTAYFGQVNDDANRGTIAENLVNSISGSVSTFEDSDGDLIDDAWKVDLVKGAITSAGSFMGTTTGMGSYNGQFYGLDMNAADEQLMPSAATGTFDGHFTNGHVLGAFAASKQATD